MRFVTVSYRTCEPDHIGEWLRDMFFNQSPEMPHRSHSKTGCYSTFELNADVRELPNESESRWGNNHEYTCAEKDFPEVGTIKMRYYWDGDGYLEFLFTDGYTIYNTDCKCSYGWRNEEPAPEHPTSPVATRRGASTEPKAESKE